MQEEEESRWRDRKKHGERRRMQEVRVDGIGMDN